ncbi:MAG: GAF domain-containing protein [Anaerolineaceae bacterium]|nr:GAF domain-containing protein [Anaerolineaceae bacterium]
MPNHQSFNSADSVKNREQRLLALLQNISLAVAKDDSIEAAFKDVLTYICRFMDWPLGHVYIWSPAAHALVSSRIWYTADASAILPFRELSEATQFRPGEGTLGMVWETGEAITILDVHHSSVFVRKMSPEKAGIRAYFAFPVMFSDRVRAVLEFFSPDSAPPDPDMISIINHVSALLGLAMQRHEMIARLQTSEAQLAEAQHTAHVGHWEWHLVRDEVYWSPELYRIYGLEPGSIDMSYKGFLSRVHPDDVSYVRSKVREAYENGRSFNYFHRIVRPNGDVRVLHARGRPVFDQAGQIIKLHGTAQDITELKETEIKLAHSVRQLSALMEIGQAISATRELEQIYQLVLTSVRPLISAEAVVLFLYKNDMLEVTAFAGINIGDLHGLRVPPDSGIAGEVWQTGRSLLLTGDDCTTRLAPELINETRYRPEAMLAVPLRWQDQSVGVLEAAHHSANAFTDDDLRLLEMAAAWTTIAIANARQYKQLQRRLSEQDALVTISNALTETLELAELFQLLVEQIQKIITKAESAAIHLHQSRSGQLELTASAGLEVDPKDYLIWSGEGIAGHVIANGGVANVADVQTDPRRLPIDVQTRTRSLLVVPIESRLRRIGTISVQSTAPGVFTADDERLLTVLGVQAGMAIENGRLFAVQRRARERAERQRERMRHMARRVVEAQEEERVRIARELHDESGQSLTSLKISLDLIRSMIPAEMIEVQQSLNDVLELTNQTISNLRLLSHNLRPPGLDVYGLDAALEGLCQDFQAHTAVQVHYHGAEVRDDLPDLAALALYRFAQEALTNAIKHASASQIDVHLWQDSDTITVTVTDNGIGFLPPNLEVSLPSKGSGLVGMVERLEMTNGRLTIDSSPGKGSRLTAVVPYTTEEK